MAWKRLSMENQLVWLNTLHTSVHPDICMYDAHKKTMKSYGT